MPKAFSAAEKSSIRTALMSTGLRHFERAGLRAARIDDICRDVGIAKGSFYAFFPSKEELFMVIVAEREAQHRADMLAFVDQAQGTAPAQAAGFFDLILSKIETDPVLNLLVVNGEVVGLVRKLGPERFARAQQEDRDFVRLAARRWARAGGPAVAPTDLLGLMTIMLSLAVQRHQMTPEQYRPAVALLRELFVTRLTEARR
jgi:AcrR family transcriptional regulator